MLAPADELARRLETSAPLGAHHPRLPARAVFFQHSVQCHTLAAAVVDRITGTVKNILPSAPGHRVFVNPDGARPKSSAPIHAIARQPRPSVAGAGEGSAASGGLAGRVFGKHRRMAGTENAFMAGWNID